MHKYVLLLVVLSAFLVIGCDETSSGGDGGGSADSTQPAKAGFNAGKPVGLYFMTRYWIATRSLEKSVWYFAPDGTAYEKLETGFSPQDLAAHKGRKGTMSRESENLVIGWPDGKRSISKMEIDKDGEGFAWDMGLFTPVSAFKDSKACVGKYEGGESISFGGNSAMTSRSLELKVDGTFAWEGVSSFKTVTDQSQMNTGSASGVNKGKWELKGYSLTLTDDRGDVRRGICFPYDDEKTPIYPDRMFYWGTMMKKLQ
jgi:hypothetical protein